jgi:hypothetical protein
MTVFTTRMGTQRNAGAHFWRLLAKLGEQTSVTYRTSSQIWFPFSVSEQCRDIEHAEICLSSMCRAGSQFEVPKSRSGFAPTVADSAFFFYFPFPSSW